MGRKVPGPALIGSGCGTSPLRQCCALPPLPKGEALAGRASPAVRLGPMGRKVPGPALIGSGICIAAVNRDSGARPFPIEKTSLVQHDHYRLASGSPFGRAVTEGD